MENQKDVFKISVNYEITIDPEDIEEIVNMALVIGGCCCHWCSEVQVVGGTPDSTEYECELVSKYGGELVFTERKSGVKYFLTRDMLVKGIQLYLQKSGSIGPLYVRSAESGGGNGFDHNCIDFVDADEIIQYALFGMLIYR